MELAYLGLFQKIFNWVLSHIFDPVFKWLASLLATALSWVFNQLLADILFPVLKQVLNYALDLFMAVFCGIFYRLFVGILKLIDYMETAFDVFIGVQDVKLTQTVINGEEISSKVIRQGSLVEVLLQQPTVSMVFWALTLGGLGIALLLTIYATAKSSFDLDFENKRPVSKVLSSLMQTFIQLFTVPLLVYFMLKLSVEILRAVSTLLGGGKETTLGRIIFVIASLNAANAEGGAVNYNTLNETLNIKNDSIRYRFYSLHPGEKSALDYSNLEQVTTYFDLKHFDYLTGIIAAVFLFFILAVCLIVFVQRIFDIILLYLVSPYFVSTFPLDDGERFGRWRELFIAKCFTGFGSAIGMRLYLMICPIIIDDSLQLGIASSPEMDYLIKLLFLIGGAWAVYKSGPMITQLLNAQAAQSESMTQTAAGASIVKNTTGRMKQLIAHHSASKKRKEDQQRAMEREAMRSLGNLGMGQKFQGAKLGGGSYGDFGGTAGQSKWTMLKNVYAARKNRLNAQKQRNLDEFQRTGRVELKSSFHPKYSDSTKGTNAASRPAKQNQAVVSVNRDLFRKNAAAASRNAEKKGSLSYYQPSLRSGDKATGNSNRNRVPIQTGNIRTELIRMSRSQLTSIKKEQVIRQLIIRENRIVTVKNGKDGNTPMYHTHKIQTLHTAKPGTGGK